MRTTPSKATITGMVLALGASALITGPSVLAHGDADEVEREPSLQELAPGLGPDSAADDPVLGTPEDPREIVITMTDELRFEPATIEVGSGEIVRFVLDNPTAAPHDFTLGDAEVQARHHDEMAAGMGHQHSADAHTDAEHADGDTAGSHHAADDHHGAALAEAELPGPVSIEPGAVVEVLASFGEPGELLIGCHVVGHWEAGMRGTIEVLDPAELMAGLSAR